MPGLDFVAVDFETANGKRESACAVGVAVVRNGEVTASESWFIKPPSSAAWFDQRNTAIHGITRDECATHGIPWVETAQRLGRLCAGLPVVAHNAPFDRSVWESANRSTGVDAPVPAFHCTLQLSRGHLDLVDHKLPTVVRHLGLDDFPHHRAEADALAAAQVTVELAQRTGASTVAELWERAPRRSVTGSSAPRPANPKQVPASAFRARVDRLTSRASQADPSVPAPTSLDGEVVVITGELTLGEREDVEERLREAGATVVKSATRKLTCLVIGAGADVRNPPLTGATGKEQRAIERIRAGQRIAVIGEPELRELLERAESSETAEDPERPAVLEDRDDDAADAAVPLAGEESVVLPVEVPAERVDGPRETTAARAGLVEEPLDAGGPPSESAPVPVRAPAGEPVPGTPAPAPGQPRRPWDPPTGDAPARPRQPWDPPLPAPAPKARRRWVFHAVMWSVMLFLTVGMFVIGLIMSLTGVPETVWAAVIGISWLIAPLVFLTWLVMTVIRAARTRRRRTTA